jgi:hypothetical protein
MSTKEYYITDNGDSEVLSDKFTVDPSFCDDSFKFSASEDLENFIGWNEDT